MPSLFYPAHSCDNPKIVGGKGASLGRLAKAGFDVPPFLVVAADAFGPAGQLPPFFLQALRKALEAEGIKAPCSVRSSGVKEDGDAHSHAGQFKTLLDVGERDLSKAVKEVVLSGMSESVREYRKVHGIDGEGGMAVVVQQMIRPRAAGVLFTVDPVRGDRGLMTISATPGLADRLVSGEVDGSDYVLAKGSGVVRSRPEADILTDRDLDRLHDLGLRIEKSFGAPQDIEWAIDEDGKVWALQARPITTLPAAVPEPEIVAAQASEPSPRPVAIEEHAKTILDNSNIVESYPGLVSPLTFSFATHVYSRVYRTFLAMTGVSKARIHEKGTVLDNMLARVDGRVYYNLPNWYRALAMLPGFRSNRKSMETMMGVSEPLPAEFAIGIEQEMEAPNRLVEIGRTAKAAAFLGWQALRLKATSRDFQRRLNIILERHSIGLWRMPLTRLVALYRQIEAEMLDRWDAPLVNDFLCMAAFGGSRRLLDKWCGPEGLAFHNDFMIGQGDIISAVPAQRIRLMARVAREIEARHPGFIDGLSSDWRATMDRHPDFMEHVAKYLDRFGDRCVQELKLESITLTDDPTPLFAAIAATARSPEPEDQDRFVSARDVLAKLLPGQPVKAFIAGHLVGYAKARVRDRENLRFERTRIFGLARRVFVRIGEELHALGHLDAPRDVFLLTVPEVLGFVEGNGATADLRGIVAVRRAESERDARLPDPPERITVTGPVRAHTTAGTKAAVAEGGHEVVRGGTGCSAGTVTGVARVVRDPSTETLAKGEILVARHTDPGWIALFANASAIVVERGSLLSHSAIVAREMGIPCVVGLKGATDWIQSGETITVDGADGRVTRQTPLERAA